MDESKIVRSRPVKQVAKSDPEGELEAVLQAAGIDGYVREMHFLWCCEHPKRKHRTNPNGWNWCEGCADELTIVDIFDGVHEYDHERDWRFDFAFLDEQVAVEVEGGVYTAGRHTRGMGFTEDARKYNRAAIEGWKVIRVTAEMVASGEALETIERALGVSAETA